VIAPTKSDDLLPQQDRNFVEDFLSGHDIRFPVAVQVRNSYPSKTKACGKILCIVKGPVAVSIEDCHCGKCVNDDQLELAIIVYVSDQDYRRIRGIDGNLLRKLQGHQRRWTESALFFPEPIST
jgi:hypothetical protein